VNHNAAKADELQKVREQQIRLQATNEKTNGYWAGNISARIENGEDPRGLVNYTQNFIQKLTSEQIRDAARRYLDTSRYARFILMPERIVP
jgi:zinc protease